MQKSEKQIFGLKWTKLGEVYSYLRLDNCRLEAQESQEASQAELAAVEGRVAKREAELRQEIIDLRSQHSKEREKWRAEGKRLQSSIKETQRRAKCFILASGSTCPVHASEVLSMASVPVADLSKEQQDELLCTYAALILHDDGAETWKLSGIELG
eukprot:s3602_g1.t5